MKESKWTPAEKQRIELFTLRKRVENQRKIITKLQQINNLSNCINQLIECINKIGIKIENNNDFKPLIDLLENLMKELESLIEEYEDGDDRK